MANSVVYAVVSGNVEAILGTLGSDPFKKITQIIGVKDELKRIEKTLSAIHGVLLDAEQQQSTNESVRNWIRNLKDVAYDIEDVLDLISTQDLERKVIGAGLRWKITRICSSYSLARELKAICCRLGDIVENQRNYSFQENGLLPPVVGPNSETETYSFVEESQTFGRKHDKEWIVSHLLASSSCGVQHLRVVPIVGIGGMGKTTLAQLAINDRRVVENFEFRLWVYISKKFVLKTAIINIIQSACGENHSHLNMEALQKKLHDTLAGQTFLIVLDDVWIEYSKQWLQLKGLLGVGVRSVILVTTREERVASLTGTTETYKLKELSEDHCWSIFSKYAFNEHEEEAYPLLVQIGKSIIGKCRGVPLAVKTVASLLHHDRDYSRWKRIEESKLWKIHQGPKDILPALKLSFDHTPYPLRLCFASCAIFKKGYPLYRIDLIRLWMAHGLLQCGEGTEDAIDVGGRYYNELLLRSFFQLPGFSITKKRAIHLVEEFNWVQGWVNHSQVCMADAISEGFRSCDGKVTCVEMHDLVHDLAAYVTGEETTVVSSNTGNISPRVRHLVWDTEDLSGKDFPKSLLEVRKARTFAFLHPMGHISKSFLDTLISNFRCLRVLMFRNSKFVELPDSVGNLKHLRYLDLCRNSQLKLLPSSVCNLVNLKVLDVGCCKRLEMLPEDVHRLVNLRIFELTFMSTWLPRRGLQGWSSLQLLRITFCPNLVSLSEEFGNLKSLRMLVIRVCNSLVQLPNDMRSLTNLERITIHTCRKLDLRGWKGLRDLRSLRILVIYNLPKLTEFPDGFESITASLQNLRISKCVSLRLLPESLKHCTSLLKLQLFDCPGLSSLPRGIVGLNILQELRILGCPELSCRCERDTGDYWQLISHIPEIYIDEKVIQSRDPSTLQGQASQF